MEPFPRSFSCSEIHSYNCLILRKKKINKKGLFFGNY